MGEQHIDQQHTDELAPVKTLSVEEINTLTQEVAVRIYATLPPEVDYFPDMEIAANYGPEVQRTIDEALAAYNQDVIAGSMIAGDMNQNPALPGKIITLSGKEAHRMERIGHLHITSSVPDRYDAFQFVITRPQVRRLAFGSEPVQPLHVTVATAEQLARVKPVLLGVSSGEITDAFLMTNPASL